MSLYKVFFKWKEKEIELMARSLDLTHPYFVSIKDLVFPDEGKLIIDPAKDEVKRVFGSSHHLMIPFQTVHMIEELREEPAPGKIRSFVLMEESQGETAGSEGTGKVGGSEPE